MAQRNFLCCKLADDNIVVPLERVLGVVEGGAVTPLPFTAPAFEGLVEAFGQVMPQIGLASVLEMRDLEAGILVVVSDRGGSLALRIPQVTAMIQSDGDALSATVASARARHPLFMAELEHQGARHYVLDLDLLATHEALQAAAPDGAVMLAEARAQTRSVAPPVDQTQTPFLLLDVCGEKYAVRNSSILELDVAPTIRRMPGAPDWILGLIDLRGTPVVAVSTASLLGLPKRAGPPPEVCLISELGDGFRIALFVDRALGLERISPTSIHAMTQAMAGVESYLVLEDHDIVGVIEPKLLVAQVEESLRDCCPTSMNQIDEEAIVQQSGQYQQLLALRVGGELYGVTLDRIARIQPFVTLTPLPSSLSYFDGMADVGDATIPVIDLRRHQAHRPTDENGVEEEHAAQPPCILTQLEGSMTGVLVDQVLNIIDIPMESFEAVRDAARLPISHVVAHEGRIISVLTLDRLLPAA